MEDLPVLGKLKVGIVSQTGRWEEVFIYSCARGLIFIARSGALVP